MLQFSIFHFQPLMPHYYFLGFVGTAGTGIAVSMGLIGAGLIDVGAGEITGFGLFKIKVAPIADPVSVDLCVHKPLLYSTLYFGYTNKSTPGFSSISLYLKQEDAPLNALVCQTKLFIAPEIGNPKI
jgi:hypothetical protein